MGGIVWYISGAGVFVLFMLGITLLACVGGIYGGIKSHEPAVVQGSIIMIVVCIVAWIAFANYDLKCMLADPTMRHITKNWNVKR